MNAHRDSKIASPQPEVLVAEGLQKSYGARHALQGLTFTLKAGRILGFLGPNGAGKTTSIRILTTMMEPESGHFTVDGISSDHPEQIRRRIGVLPENLGFPRQMTGIEYLTYFGQLYGRSPANAREFALALLEDVGMQQRSKSLIGSYSHGMKQRIGIARALINDPVVVFLDEPTLGLDPRGQQELLELIQRIARERGTGVILCSHLLSEIENICDDVVILSSGQIVARGTVAEVVDRVQRNIVLGNALRIQVPPDFVAKATQALKAAIPNVTKVTPIGEMEGWLRVELIESANGNSEKSHLINNTILGALIRAKIPILSFEVEGGRLQDVFLHLTEEAIQ
ncbi:MAG TPA: ABC transporter ATP-binding protein [Anaerolineales bacterium]|nr:ABC transporter ATP-binding protein [Anaerolineales bacterium]